ncbi:MAG: biopolymer transporter ExbD [Granulosicoccus sp.]|nr:biopolymer transporter ExbD [Granulosicoccus sp.]
MIFREQRPTAVPAIDLTTLINIVFLMLVFFMLSGSLEPLDPVQPAQVESQRRIEQDLLVISVDQSGSVLIDGQHVDDATLRYRLSSHHALGGQTAIKPDARLEAPRLVELASVVRQAGFDQLILITRSPR